MNLGKQHENKKVQQRSINQRNEILEPKDIRNAMKKATSSLNRLNQAEERWIGLWIYYHVKGK